MPHLGGNREDRPDVDLVGLLPLHLLLKLFLVREALIPATFPDEVNRARQQQPVDNAACNAVAFQQPPKPTRLHTVVDLEQVGGELPKFGNALVGLARISTYQFLLHGRHT